MGEHPTQALSDAVCLMNHFGFDRAEQLEGLVIAVAGDLKHSRVARSWSLLAARLGIRLYWLSPASLKPVEWGEEFEWTSTKSKAIEDADVIMSLRVQRERFEQSESLDSQALRDVCILPSDLEDRDWMHPGPVNWGIEADVSLKNDSRSLVLKQTEAGRFLRAAVLDFLCEV